MNRVLISGKFANEGPRTNGERLLVIETLEVKPKTILIKTKLEIALHIGDVIEGEGEIGDQEAMFVDGQILKTAEGRQVMRNYIRITELRSVASCASSKITTQNSNELNTTQRRATVVSIQRPAAPINSKGNENVYNGPELPWPERV